LTFAVPARKVAARHHALRENAGESLMPLYEYHCPSCHKDIELLVRGGEQPNCPECGSSRMERLLSVVAAHTGGGKSSPDPLPFAGCGKPGCGPGGCGRGML